MINNTTSTVFHNAIPGSSNPAPLCRATYPKNVLPPVRMHRGTDPALSASYAESLKSLSFNVLFQNSSDFNFKSNYDKTTAKLAGHDFELLFRTAIQRFLVSVGVEILNIRILPSGDALVRLAGFVDWITMMFDNPNFFTYTFPGPTGPIRVEAPRVSRGIVQLLRLEFRGCGSRLEPEDIAAFLENAPNPPFSLGQYVIRYKKIGPYWANGDYQVFINTPLHLSNFFPTTKGVRILDAHHGQPHIVEEIVEFQTGATLPARAAKSLNPSEFPPLSRDFQNNRQRNSRAPVPSVLPAQPTTLADEISRNDGVNEEKDSGPTADSQLQQLLPAQPSTFDHPVSGIDLSCISLPQPLGITAVATSLPSPPTPSRSPSPASPRPSNAPSSRSTSPSDFHRQQSAAINQQIDALTPPPLQPLTASAPQTTVAAPRATRSAAPFPSAQVPLSNFFSQFAVRGGRGRGRGGRAEFSILPHSPATQLLTEATAAANQLSSGLVGWSDDPEDTTPQPLSVTTAPDTEDGEPPPPDTPPTLALTTPQ